MSHPAITVAVDVSDTGGVFAATTPCGRRVCLRILTLTGLKSHDSREVDSLGTPKGFRGLPCWTGYPRLPAGSQKFFGYDVASRSASVRMFRAAFTSLS